MIIVAKNELSELRENCQTVLINAAVESGFFKGLSAPDRDSRLTESSKKKR